MRFGEEEDDDGRFTLNGNSIHTNQIIQGFGKLQYTPDTHGWMPAIKIVTRETKELE